MINISPTTLHTIALLKIIFFIYIVFTIFLIIKKTKPWTYLILLTTTFTSFYLVFSWKLQKMFWGNVGDESFITAFLTKVLHGGYFSDFYYNWLPPFYPPLYFWVTGTIARFFTDNAVTASKIGVALVLSLWFVLPYLWQKFFWERCVRQTPQLRSQPELVRTTSQLEKTRLAGVLESPPDKGGWGVFKITASPCFWLTTPLLFLISLDFDNIITKPYEVLPALLCVIFIGLINESFDLKKWDYKIYLFFGISGGLLFLTYYFWWFVLIPTLFVLALISNYKKENFIRIIFFGSIIFIIASPYLIPLILSFKKFGLESWQGTFLVPQDFYTFLPWVSLSLKSILLFFGATGLLFGFYKKDKFISSTGCLLIVSFAYQFLNLIYFTLGHKPLQQQKPFLFLGGACLIVGLAYLLIYFYQNYIIKLSENLQKTIIIGFFILLLPLFPFVKFIDNDQILEQMDRDLKASDLKPLTDFIKNNIKDYDQRTWLSSGSADLNVYLPLFYYLATSPHFSHPAVIYSKRLLEIEKITKTKTPEEFMQTINNISGLILYYDEKTDSYPLFFWQDNYPNGGKELIFYLPENLIIEKNWEKVYNNGNWVIFIKK